jgi:hypothetical protein
MPLWVFGVAVFVAAWLQYWSKHRYEMRKAYIDRHSGQHDAQVANHNVERIKRMMDRDFELEEQGPLIQWGYRPHQRGPLLAIPVFVLRLILLLLDDLILGFLLWLFMDLPFACRRLHYADIKKNAIKWCKHRYQRQKNTDDIEMTSGQPTQVDTPPHPDLPHWLDIQPRSGVDWNGRAIRWVSY